jgi:hypothetical protein
MLNRDLNSLDSSAVNLYIGGRFILKKIKILGHVDKHRKKSMFDMKFWNLPIKNLEKIYT